MICLSCPTCGGTLKLPPDRAGSVLVCGECGEQLRVPENPVPQQPAPPPTPQKPLSVDPPGTLMLCYACKRDVANNAPTCPKCGAVQTPEGRERGRQLKRTYNYIAASMCAAVLALMLFIYLLEFRGSHSPTPPPNPKPWDLNRLKRDVDRAVSEPGKTIFVPADGSQPLVVPDPDTP